MSSIHPAVAQALQAQTAATNQQIGIAVLGKQLDAQQQAGDAINEMLQQAANVQQQLASGHLDVRV